MGSTDHVKQGTDDLYDSTLEVTGSSSWERESYWTHCGEVEGRQYVSFNVLASRQGSLSSAPEQLVREVQDAWERLGVKAAIGRDDAASSPRVVLADPPIGVGSNGDGSSRQFWASDGAVSFSASSPCVVGDLGALNSSRTDEKP